MRWKDIPLVFKIFAYAFLIFFTIVTVMPFMYFLSLSVSNYQDTFKIFIFPRDLNFSNYQRAFETVDLGLHFRNSVYITASALFLNLTTGSMAAYAMARFKFPLREPIYNLFLAGLIFSYEALLIPLFLNAKQFDLLNKPYTLPIIYATVGLPLTIFILRAFFESLPTEVMDAAMVDGANAFQTFFRIALPMSRSGLVTVGLFQFVFYWDDFALSFTLISDPELRPLSSGLARLYGEYFIDYPVLAAALVVTVTPVIIVFLLSQKQLVRGITMGAVK
ncbi:MAG: carbohydrate ABC transporter permease [Anaerolineae bacterium]|nr:carbohydrate ABC transporter permease [Anaerolineae bacterium]